MDIVAQDQGACPPVLPVPKRAKDLTGKRFGRLRVIGFGGFRYPPGKGSRWVCRCDCGGWKLADGGDLKRGKTTSCGCRLRDVLIRRNRTHGFTRHPLFQTWRQMIRRCYDPRATNYRWYGKLGVRVCDRWRRSFEAFLEDMEPRPPGTSLDRIDPFGDYEPGNCRWADAITQANNKRRHHHESDPQHRPAPDHP